MDVYAELKAIKQAHQDLLDSLEDSGWQNLTLSPEFNHNGTMYLQVRKIGNIASIRGYITVAETIDANTNTQVCTVPSGFSPTGQTIYFLAQGSGMNRCLFSITPSGIVYVQKYGTTINSQISSGVGMQISNTWFLN